MYFTLTTKTKGMREGASEQSSDLKNYTAPGPRPPVLKFLDPPLISSVFVLLYHFYLTFERGCNPRNPPPFLIRQCMSHCTLQFFKNKNIILIEFTLYFDSKRKLYRSRSELKY